MKPETRNPKPESGQCAAAANGGLGRSKCILGLRPQPLRSSLFSLTSEPMADSPARGRFKTRDHPQFGIRISGFGFH